MISIQHINKSYGKKGEIPALQDISLDVKKGEVFGLIGPDGAGKTTLFRILTTLILPDSGSASVAGFDIITQYKDIRRCVGYMPGKFSLYQDLSVEENLSFYATIFDTTVEANYHLIKDIYDQLAPFKTRRAGALSGGMKQKLALCCALIHKPTVLFLDEPTTGVDVVSRKEFWAMLDKLKKDGITIFVSTPYMDEASLCDRIALIQNGSILSIDTPSGLIQNFKYPVFGVRTDNMTTALKQLSQQPGMQNIFPFGEYMHIIDERSTLSVEQISRFLSEHQHQNIDVQQIKPEVEDVFIQLMKENNSQ
ncbi:MAG TPA: ABC transporter ATP-binding protein [Saprospiraceae bacterium]|nr:ABC transporter ATP-binding protein [Saprospiraceae bacterium]MBK9741988.1 ABC transporter ATP-binding protein [Saprospiraceae bacterium]HQV97891.1 ABC transporter ATP-binding protein [Saprospiraceae bacterium]